MQEESSTVDLYATSLGVEPGFLAETLSSHVPQGKTLEEYLQDSGKAAVRIIFKRQQGTIHVGAT